MSERILVVGNSSGFFTPRAIHQSLLYSGHEYTLNQIEVIYNLLRPDQKRSLEVMKHVKEKLKNDY